MAVELKNVKYAKFASQETNCFEAQVYIDGKRAGAVSNEGHGGPDWFETNDLRNRLKAIAKADPKYAEFEFEPESVLIGDLLNFHLVRKDMARLSKNVMFFENHDGKLCQTGKLTAQLRNAVVLNPQLYLDKLKAKRFIDDIDEVTRIAIGE